MSLRQLRQVQHDEGEESMNYAERPRRCLKSRRRPPPRGGTHRRSALAAPRGALGYLVFNER